MSWSDKLFFWSVSVRRSGSLSLGVAHPFFSQAFRIHAVVILIFLWGVSAGITRMETSFFLFLSLQHCSHAKNAKLLWRGSLFQALVEVSGLIFMDVQSPLGIVTTFRWVYTNPPTPTPPPPPPPFFSLLGPPVFFPLLPIFRAWWTAAKWAVFLLFQQRGHLYSIPGSQVSYSAPLQVMSRPWKVLQINLSWCFEGNLTSMHSSFHCNN